VNPTPCLLPPSSAHSPCTRPQEGRRVLEAGGGLDGALNLTVREFFVLHSCLVLLFGIVLVFYYNVPPVPTVSTDGTDIDVLILQ